MNEAAEASEQPVPTEAPVDANAVTEDEVLTNTQETAEEMQRRAQQEMAERIENSKTIDPLTYLTRSNAVNEGNTYYTSGFRFFASDRSAPISTNFQLRIGNIHIAGQSLVKFVQPRTVFSLEDFQKAYSNVPLLEGASEEKQALMTRTVLALTRLAWDSGKRYTETLSAHLDGVLVANAEALRIPVTKDGGAFEGVDILFNATGGQFRPDNIGGIVLRYAGAQNHYVILFNDFADPNSEESFAARVFVSELIQFRNFQTDAFIHADLNNLFELLVAEVGPEIVKSAEEPAVDTSAEAVNDDSEAPADTVQADAPVATEAEHAEHHHGHHGHHHHH